MNANILKCHLLIALLACGSYCLPVFSQDNKEIITKAKLGSGEKDFHKYLYSHIHYPLNAQKENKQGKTLFLYTIGMDGGVSNIVAIKQIDKECTDNVIKAMKSSPRWSPATKNGKPTEVTDTLAIFFKLRGGDTTMDIEPQKDDIIIWGYGTTKVKSPTKSSYIDGHSVIKKDIIGDDTVVWEKGSIASDILIYVANDKLEQKKYPQAKRTAALTSYRNEVLTNQMDSIVYTLADANKLIKSKQETDIVILMDINPEGLIYPSFIIKANNESMFTSKDLYDFRNAIQNKIKIEAPGKYGINGYVRGSVHLKEREPNL